MPAIKFASAPVLKRLAPLTGLLAYGLIFGLVSSTGLDHPYDKMQHLVFFGLLTLALSSTFRLALPAAAALAIGLGLFGEALQALLPHHQASLLDATANSVGALSVAAAMALFRSEASLAETLESEEGTSGSGGNQFAPAESFGSISVSSEK